MSIGLAVKDQHIVKVDKCIIEVEKCIIDLEKHINVLNMELDEVKRGVEVAFAISFNEAMKQAKHFFIDNELNFNLLYSSKILEDITSQDG